MALKAPLSHRSVPPRIAFTMFLDFLGFGMIIPVSPSFFSAENHLLFSPETGASDRVLFYGLMMGFFGLSTFFFAPWLGAISDRLGRRKVLMITNICNGSLYGVSAWAILTANPVLFIISRIVPGMCGASVFIVQSSLSDVSNKENKANNLGWVGVSFGAGTILGALVGGLLADKSILPFAAHWIPFVTAMIFSSLNLLYVIFFLPETLRHRNPSRLTIWKGIENIRFAFQHKDLKHLFYTMFVLTCGFAFFIQFLPIFLKGEFGFAENGVAGTYAFLGLAAGLTQGVGIRLAGKWMPGHRLLRFTLPLFALSYLALLLSRAPVFFYSLVPFLILFQSLSFPNLLALISNQATATEQGETIGINQSLQSLGSALSAFFAGLSISFDNRLIFVIGFFSASAAALIFIFGFRKNKAPAL